MVIITKETTDSELQGKLYLSENFFFQLFLIDCFRSTQLELPRKMHFFTKTQESSPISPFKCGCQNLNIPGAEDEVNLVQSQLYPFISPTLIYFMKCSFPDITQKKNTVLDQPKVDVLVSLFPKCFSGIDASISKYNHC